MTSTPTRPPAASGIPARHGGQPVGGPVDAYVYDAIRTPRGKGRATGALHEVPPIDVMAGLIREHSRRNPALDPNLIDDVILGVVTPIGEQGGDIARFAALVGGLPETVAGVQINRFCASGLEAVNMAAEKVRSGWYDWVLAGGVESMSRVPMGSDGGAWMDDERVVSALGIVPQGISADLIATLNGMTRRDLDSYAAQSQQRAAAAVAAGAFDRSIVPVSAADGSVLLAADEHPRPGTTVDTLAALPPAFEDIGRRRYDRIALGKYPQLESINHLHTAGNSSGIVDGAALVSVGSLAAGQQLGLTPRARIVATAITGAEPTIMLTGPAPAIRKALRRSGLQIQDIDLFEINEAFAAVPLQVMAELGVPAERVNVNGGAIALGHPLGATGAMLLGTLLDEMDSRELRYGVVSLCIGGGMGIATVVERWTGAEQAR